MLKKTDKNKCFWGENEAFVCDRVRFVIPTKYLNGNGDYAARYSLTMEFTMKLMVI